MCICVYVRMLLYMYVCVYAWITLLRSDHNYQVGHLNKVLLSLSSQLHSIETQLYTRLVLLKQFYQKWHQFKLWLNDTRQLLQSSGKSLSCRDVDKTAASNPEELTRLQVGQPLGKP